MPTKNIATTGSPLVKVVAGGVDGLRSAIRDILGVLNNLGGYGSGDSGETAVTYNALDTLGYVSLASDVATRIEGWDDITADLGSGKVAGANQPTWSTYRDGIQAYEFSPTTMKELWITFHVKHDYKDGTNVYPHVHWSPNTTSTGTVRWGFEYTVAKGHDQAAFPATVTVYAETTISVDKQYQHFISEVVDGDAFNAFEPDTVILMRVFRDAAHANDTFPDAVHAFTADIHFQGDGQFTPNKAAPFE